MKLKRIHCKIAWCNLMLNYYKLRRELAIKDSLSGKITPQESLSIYLEDSPLEYMVIEYLDMCKSMKIRLFLEKIYIILKFSSKKAFKELIKKSTKNKKNVSNN